MTRFTALIALVAVLLCMSAVGGKLVKIYSLPQFVHAAFRGDKNTFSRCIEAVCMRDRLLFGSMRHSMGCLGSQMPESHRN
jgi:hypothetical protein